MPKRKTWREKLEAEQERKVVDNPKGKKPPKVKDFEKVLEGL